MLIKQFNSNKKRAVVSGIYDAGHQTDGRHLIYIRYTEVDEVGNVTEKRHYQSLSVSNKKDSEFVKTMKGLNIDMTNEDLSIEELLFTEVLCEIESTGLEQANITNIEYVGKFADKYHNLLDDVICEFSNIYFDFYSYRSIPSFILHRIFNSEEFKNGKLS